MARISKAAKNPDVAVMVVMNSGILDVHNAFVPTLPILYLG